MMDKSRKKSLVWSFFNVVDSQSVQCMVCRCYFRRIQGSTTNMLRHLRVKHPDEVSIRSLGGGAESSACTEPEDEEQYCSVEVALEDGDSESISTLNESAINSILEASQTGPEELLPVKEIGDDNSSGRSRHKRSLIWKYFERLDGVGAVKCLICLAKLQCCKSGNTSNLRRHMSKKHPEVFSELIANGQQPSPLKSPRVSNANGEAHETFSATEQIKIPGLLKCSGASERDSHALKREWELIEALRRAQKEEARTLEHQRELLEKLRAADAREAAAEREKIELLRKAQQEEAEDIRRQRKELQEEKNELEKKRQELQKERE